MFNDLNINNETRKDSNLLEVQKQLKLVICAFERKRKKQCIEGADTEPTDKILSALYSVYALALEEKSAKQTEINKTCTYIYHRKYDEWICNVCGNVVRGNAIAYNYCSKCGSRLTGMYNAE